MSQPEPTTTAAGRRKRPAKMGVDDRDAALAALKQPPAIVPSATAAPYHQQRLNELAALLPGWDSYGGDPPTAEALRTADSVVFIPCADGGMQVEMHAGGMDIEVYIEPSGAIFGVFAEQARRRT